MRRAATVAMLLMLVDGCSHMGRLRYQPQTVSPTLTHKAGEAPPANPAAMQLQPLFGDTLIGLVPGTADSSRRYLGRLHTGFTADTLNLMLFGDNRPGWRASRLSTEYTALREMFSPNLAKIGRGLVTIPWALVKGLYPDLALIRDIPDRLRKAPTAGRERQVVSAMLAKIDSLQAHGQSVAAVLNTGDLVYDGRYPSTWERFLRITRPLSSRVPYFPVAGNHERTDTEDGRENWRTATGLPVGGDRLYYCFDTADGWLRVIALDSNPIVDPGNLWTREVQIKYSAEEFAWLTERVKEHRGPVIVFMHHPPFSAGFHRVEWQRDSVLSKRRETMVEDLHKSGISIIAGGHEHAYERALLRWPDAVLIAIVSGGAGAPLYPLPPRAEAARVMSEYHVAGSTVQPADVFTAQAFHFIHLRFWFGGGEFYTYAVDDKAKATLIDKVQIDLSRYGTPKIDQFKIPIPPAKGQTSASEATEEKKNQTVHPVTKADSTASKRLLSKPAPARKTTRRKP